MEIPAEIAQMSVNTLAFVAQQGLWMNIKVLGKNDEESFTETVRT